MLTRRKCASTPQWEALADVDGDPLVWTALLHPSPRWRMQVNGRKIIPTRRLYMKNGYIHCMKDATQSKESDPET